MTVKYKKPAIGHSRLHYKVGARFSKTSTEAEELQENMAGAAAGRQIRSSTFSETAPCVIAFLAYEHFRPQ
jgi:hypothetical protein